VVKPKVKWYWRQWAIVIWIFLGAIIIIAIFGDTIDEVAEKQRILTEQARIDDENKPISKGKALQNCNKKATECSDNIPAIATELKLVCLQLYQYTSDSSELIDFTDGMC